MSFISDYLFMAAFATLRKELRALLRSPKVFLAVGAFAGLLGLLCASSYPYGGAATSQVGVQYARSMVGIQLFGLWLAALTAIPALAILGQHQDLRSGNLDQFACTPLRPRTLYWSKALTLATLYLLGAAAVLPVSGIAFFLAGVEVRLYLGQLATLLCFAACMIAISLQIAAHVPSTLPAFIRTLAIGLSFGGGIPILVTGYHSTTISCYIVGLTSALLVWPDLIRHAHEFVRNLTQFDAILQTAQPRRRATFEFRDDHNPVSTKEDLLFTQNRYHFRVGCIMFPTGFSVVAIAFLGAMGGPNNPFHITSYLTDLLLYGTVAVVTAAIFSQDCERSALDALRVTLLSGDEFLQGKVRAAWRAFALLLVGFYTADAFLMPLMWQQEPPLRVLYHIVLVGLNLPEFHIVLLLAAAGTTFGHSTTARITSAILWSIPGLFIPSFAGDYLEFILVRPSSPQDYLGQFGAFVGSYTLLVGIALAIAVVFARWRFRCVWRGGMVRN